MSEQSYVEVELALPSDMAAALEKVAMRAGVPVAHVIQVMLAMRMISEPVTAEGSDG